MSSPAAQARIAELETRIAELEARTAGMPGTSVRPALRPKPAPKPAPPDVGPLWRFTIEPVPQPGSTPMRTGVTVSPADARGQQRPTVFRGLRSPGETGTGERGIVVMDTDIVDAALHAFLEAHSYGANLVPCEPPTDGTTPLSAPGFIRRWLNDQIAAGRLIITAPAVTLPPAEVRRRLREQVGLSRPQVAEQLAVSKEIIRLWELGEREPGPEHRDKYLSLLTSWMALEPVGAPSSNGAKPPPVPQPAPERDGDPPEVEGALREAEEPAEEAGPLTPADRQAARAAAFRSHRQAMSPSAKPPTGRPSFVPGDLVPRIRFDGAEQ